jgi:hypothetical protein
MGLLLIFSIVLIPGRNETEILNPRPRLPTRARGTLRLSLLLQNISKCYPLAQSHVNKFPSPKSGPPAGESASGVGWGLLASHVVKSGMKCGHEIK